MHNIEGSEEFSVSLIDGVVDLPQPLQLRLVLGRTHRVEVDDDEILVDDRIQNGDEIEKRLT